MPVPTRWPVPASWASALLAAAVVLAGGAAADPVSLTDAEVDRIVRDAADAVAANYADPAIADTIATALRGQVAAGDYHGASDGATLAAAVTRALGGLAPPGTEIWMDHAPGAFSDGNAPRIQHAVARFALLMPVMADGVAEVRRLPGNIGYVRLTSAIYSPGFPAQMAAAMALQASSFGLILDLRDCAAADPVMSAQVVGQFVDAASPGAQSAFVLREDAPLSPALAQHVAWLSARAAPPPDPVYGDARPVHVLVSDRTSGGCQEIAYNLAVTGRATIVGNGITGTASIGWYAPGNSPDFAVFLPVGELVNLGSGTNWQRHPLPADIATPVADAVRVAHHEQLRLTADQRAAYPELRAEIAMPPPLEMGRLAEPGSN
jgi:retinol-binding protein 3